MRHDNIRVQGNLAPERRRIAGFVSKGPLALKLRIRRPEHLECRLWTVGSGQADNGCLVLKQYDRGLRPRDELYALSWILELVAMKALTVLCIKLWI
jgi:hypothetical protein